MDGLLMDCLIWALLNIKSYVPNHIFIAIISILNCCRQLQNKTIASKDADNPVMECKTGPQQLD